MKEFPGLDKGEKHTKVENVHRIAVLRANGIGDFTFVLPALEALRAAYPQTELLFLGRPWHAAFLEGRSGPVDRVVVVPVSHGVHEAAGQEEDEEALERFFERMAGERIDLALQLHGGGRNSNPFLLRLGARVTAGLRTPDAPPLDRWVPYVFYQPEIMRYLEVVSRVGAEVVTLEPRVTVMDRDLQESYAVVAQDDRPLVALHPGAGDPRRHWPVEKFAAVGDSLAGRGARVVVTGARREGELAAGVVRAMRAPAQDTCGQLSINGLAGLLARCRVVVSNDSGPLHLAAAVGAATVGIYWVGNLITAGLPFRTAHRPAISWRLECPVCGVDCTRDVCPHSASFVADVGVEEVQDAALDLLASC
jgi:ADP-heptose:LPS heptosyltransferase